VSPPEIEPASPVPVDPPTDDEYAALDVSTGWPVLSLVCFLGALGARFLVRLVPGGVVGWPWRLVLPVLGVLGLSFLGLVFGLLGLRRVEHRGLARAGILLNAVGLVLGVLAVAAFFWILRGPR
jgi:hypothetical protein